MYANIFYGANYLPSDASLKKDVVPAIRSGLGDIETLKVVDFTWKADNKPDTGLIPQQARSVNPAYCCESDGLAHIAQYPLIVSLYRPVSYRIVSECFFNYMFLVLIIMARRFDSIPPQLPTLKAHLNLWPIIISKL